MPSDKKAHLSTKKIVTAAAALSLTSGYPINQGTNVGQYDPRAHSGQAGEGASSHYHQRRAGEMTTAACRRVVLIHLLVNVGQCGSR